MKGKIWVMVWIASGVALCVLAVVILTSYQKRDDSWSMEYVTTQEAATLMSFTYYDVQGWRQQLEPLMEGRISYRELENLLDFLGVKEYVTYQPGKAREAVPRELFMQVYDQIVDLLDVEKQVSVHGIVLLKEDPEQPGRWLTQEGWFQLPEQVEIQAYDMYQVYCFEQEIIGLQMQQTEPILWENIFVHNGKEPTLQVLFQGETLELPLTGLQESILDTICDIQWTQGQISAIYKKEDTIQGTVLSYDESSIEISGYGKLQHDGDLKLYKTYGSLEQLDAASLIIGNLSLDVVVAKGEVCGIILRAPVSIQEIRVLLLREGEPCGAEVYVVSDVDTEVSFGDNTTTLSAGTLITASTYWTQGQESYLKIQPVTEEGKLYLADAQGHRASLGYGGSFEIRRYSQGYALVNQLSLEEYLYSVVPSEMPSTYGQEALRAQAVCARSYACIQLMRDEYAGYGANVDDSTNYQVYNKQERTEATTLAVQDTMGQVICYQGEIAEAYYYSTSCGSSQDITVWKLPQKQETGYLGVVSLLTQGELPNLSQEEDFGSFIRDSQVTAFDSDVRYFRWKARVDLKGQRQALEEAIRQRKAANGDAIQILGTNGTPFTKDLKNLGELERMEVVERSAGGVLSSLRLCFAKGSVLVDTEYNIRSVLGAVVTSLEDREGKSISGMSLLPSAAFAITPTETDFLLEGGGYGHGIGLSQNGANGMAQAGYSYLDILQKFYQNITIENIYGEGDSVWSGN